MEYANQYLGNEPVSRLMRQYAVPCIISLLVGALYNIVDQIFIGIVPLGLTLLCYYLLKKKNISITVLIIGVIILSILLSLLGIA